MCGGGPSQSQKDLAAQQAEFYKTMTAQQTQEFANQSKILDTLKAGWAQTFEAGINQYGFNPAQDAALRTEATQGTAAAYGQAATAVRSAGAARGGDGFIPSGQNAQIDASLAQATAAQESGQQLDITKAGYDLGRQNYLQASNIMGGVAQQYNPTGYISGANQAGTDAYGSAKTNQEMANAASPWNAVSGILGGALTTGINAFTGGIGGTLAKTAMGGGSGGSSSAFDFGGGFSGG